MSSAQPVVIGRNWPFLVLMTELWAVENIQWTLNSQCICPSSRTRHAFVFTDVGQDPVSKVFLVGSYFSRAKILASWKQNKTKQNLTVETDYIPKREHWRIARQYWLAKIPRPKGTHLWYLCVVGGNFSYLYRKWAPRPVTLNGFAGKGCVCPRNFEEE